MKSLYITVVAVFLVSFAVAPKVSIAQPAAEYRVVVNYDNSVAELSKADLAKIFLKRTRRWPNGTEIIPIDQRPQATVRENFSQMVHRRSTAAIKGYWQNQVFAGRGSPPREIESDERVVAFVQNNPGAIGYVSPRSVMNQVKVVIILE